jgi:pyruvate,water dikinase
MASPRLVVPFEELRMTDVEEVGGKNASLGEMISQLAAAGIRVPGGFATTRPLSGTSSRTTTSREDRRRLEGLDVDDVRRWPRSGARSAAGSRRRRCSLRSRRPYEALRAARGAVASRVVRGRSSATAEDLPDASFARQQETFLISVE